jgi:hypothetical protein
MGYPFLDWMGTYGLRIQGSWPHRRGECSLLTRPSLLASVEH